MTLLALVERWESSPGYTNLAPKSKAIYQTALKHIAPKHGHRLAADATPEKLEKIIAEIRAETPALANVARKMLRLVFSCAVKPLKIRRDNPAIDLPKFKTGEHHTWTDAELAQYEKHWPLGTPQRFGYAWLLYSAQRVGDIERLERIGVHGDAVHLRQQKTGEAVAIALHPKLKMAIKAGPHHDTHAVCDGLGRPFKHGYLGKLIKAAALDAGLPMRCRPHGLRYAAVRRMAEWGATTNEIAAVSGHRTLAMITKYTSAAEREKLAKNAMRRLKH
jgi:enterobacteria phage integrase